MNIDVKRPTKQRFLFSSSNHITCGIQLFFVASRKNTDGQW